MGNMFLPGIVESVDCLQPDDPSRSLPYGIILDFSPRMFSSGESRFATVPRDDDASVRVHTLGASTPATFCAALACASVKARHPPHFTMDELAKATRT